MVCLDDPLDGATVGDSQQVSASVRVAGGAIVHVVVFTIDGGYVLSDFIQPYTFALATDRWADGPHALAVQAVTTAGDTSTEATVDLTFSNPGGPPTRPRFVPRTGSVPAPGAPFVVAAVGDGASGHPESDAVGDRIGSWEPNLFLYLGDVYERGSETEFVNWYGDGTGPFGRFRDITDPASGNHEWNLGPGAPGYAAYWGGPPAYYSVDTAGWHIVSLTSDPRYGQLAPGSGQLEWLRSDLEASAARCTLVFFHHPTWSLAGSEATRKGNLDLWRLLADRGVELVLNGHDHDYQRWTPLDRDGRPSPEGVTQVVVGTGGHNVYPFRRSDARLVRGFDAAPEAVGALKLELGTDAAGFRYESAKAGRLDEGTIPCHDAPPPPPTLFSDGFESGSLSAWTASSGLVPQQAEVATGSWAARGTSTGGVTYAAKQLAQTYSELRFRTRFKVLSQGQNPINLLRLQTSGGAASLLTLFQSISGNLMLRNDVSGVSIWSSAVPARGVWHEAEVRLKVGSPGETEVWLDGARLAGLSGAQSVGTTPIGRLLLGDSVKGRTYDVAFDDVVGAVPQAP